MANYSIVLNLRGSAVTNSKKLADNLERADKAAKSLKGNLQGMPNVPTGGRGGFGGGGGSTHPRGTTFGGGLFHSQTSLSTHSGLGTVVEFSGKLNAALGIINAVFSGAALAAKIAAKTASFTVLGGVKALKFGTDILTSAQMGEGIKLLQRRQQARLGFGASYAEAQSRADLLAASYGLDPSNVIASMNVLAGMRVGNKKISVGQAERLTQVGGLIAQASGQSFENVMVNIQQMMAQTVPSMRDIRQLLTHAPILSRYALQEMEKRGIAGDPMEFLQQNKDVMMSVFERYLAENPAILTMRARGMVQQANVGLYAKLAENPAWLEVADRYAQVMSVFGEAASSLLSAAVNNDALTTSISLFAELMSDAPTIIEKVNEKLNEWLKELQKLGWVAPDTVEKYLDKVGKDEAKRKALKQWVADNPYDLYDAYSTLGISKDAPTEQFIATAQSLLGKNFGEYFTDVPFYPIVSNIDKEYHYGQKGYEEALNKARSGVRNFNLVTHLTPNEKERQRLVLATQNPNFTPYGTEITSSAGYVFNPWQAYSSLYSPREEETLKDLADPTRGSNGEAISGYGMDRKSLTINFNQPIVKWDSSIYADDPQDVVNTVSETIEGAAARAIQIALLGATGTMSTRY